jgi:protein-L-isoaspartate O-methyltransferase
MERDLKPSISLVLFTAILAMLVACDRDEAQHKLVITGPVHVYKTEIPPAAYPGTDFIAELGPQDHPKILQVKSGSGYRAAKVRLADGRDGWVFTGESIDIK